MRTCLHCASPVMVQRLYQQGRLVETRERSLCWKHTQENRAQNQASKVRMVTLPVRPSVREAFHTLREDTDEQR